MVNNNSVTITTYIDNVKGLEIGHNVYDKDNDTIGKIVDINYNEDLDNYLLFIKVFDKEVQNLILNPKIEKVSFDFFIKEGGNN